MAEEKFGYKKKKNFMIFKFLKIFLHLERDFFFFRFLVKNVIDILDNKNPQKLFFMSWRKKLGKV